MTMELGIADDDPKLIEKIIDNEIPDPDETPIRDRRLVTNPYDLVIDALLDQIENGTLHLRPISDRPSFQRKYVWGDGLASKFIESILLSVPIPPCYLSQNDDFELDVIDGQQRIYSIYRYTQNHFVLNGLEVLPELNGQYFHALDKKLQRKIKTYTLRCVIITNDSHPEIKFDVFERLNSNTVPLNAQELRNCIFRGPLMELINELASDRQWLEILNRKEPDKRMKGEELILRFFAFHILGLKSYRTPQKHWLNDVAKQGRKFSDEQLKSLRAAWGRARDNALLIFSPKECFRRLPLPQRGGGINKALFDLTMVSLANINESSIKSIANTFKVRYAEILQDQEFEDLISRAIDHRKRTNRRFEMWEEKVIAGLF